MQSKWKKWLKITGVLLLVLLVAAAIYAYLTIWPTIKVGTGYVAHQACSCVHIGGRTLESCLADIPESMSSISAEVVTEGGQKGVRASALFNENTAIHEAGYGCALK
ncbi:MAG: hypothetical protein AAF512_08390 [Pseudomonadota bacterium]